MILIKFLQTKLSRRLNLSLKIAQEVSDLTGILTMYRLINKKTAGHHPQLFLKHKSTLTRQHLNPN